MLELEGRFPRTFKRSFFGIKMSEEDLNNRCSGLGYWMNGILTRYHSLDIERKHIVNEFLRINSGKTQEEEARNKAIIHALSQKPSRDNIKCSEARISYAVGDVVQSPSISIPERESVDSVRFPSVPAIPEEVNDGKLEAADSLPEKAARNADLDARHLVSSGTEKSSSFTVFASVGDGSDQKSNRKVSNDSLETIAAESTDSDGTNMQNVSKYLLNILFVLNNDCSQRALSSRILNMLRTALFLKAKPTDCLIQTLTVARMDFFLKRSSGILVRTYAS